ncbi:hypothetical protein NQ317_004564 [Molorchus minor]|uniref:Uncharacterized protein n=1 Tax=Molorchus minor TaxID=1323400 RepID=A0ABQ9K070_9CUCU|nr:hypothetical protein NQ317_004564 [Molorchus minor]
MSLSALGKATGGSSIYSGLLISSGIFTTDGNNNFIVCSWPSFRLPTHIQYRVGNTGIYNYRNNMIYGTFKATDNDVAVDQSFIVQKGCQKEYPAKCHN